MQGIFTTRKYDRAGRLDDVVVSRNSFTLVGMEWMWGAMAGMMRDPEDGHMLDHLGSARIIVGNGTAGFSFEDTRLSGTDTDQAQLDQPPVIRRVADAEGVERGVEIVFGATFGERSAVFDWAERGVVTAQGILIDRAVSDQGRKPLGVVWTVEAALRLDG